MNSSHDVEGAGQYLVALMPRSKNVHYFKCISLTVWIATLNFPGPWITCGGYLATICVTMTPRSRSKVKKRIFAMVYHQLHSI